MFNDLNSPNQPARPAVDDIFAETDKATSGGAPGVQSDIETHRVGLAATGETLPPIETEQPEGNKKILKLVIIVVVVLVILGGAYFVYSQFFTPKGTDLAAVPNSKTETPNTNGAGTTTKTTETEFVALIPSASSSPTTINPVELATSTGVIEATTSTTTLEIPADSLIDSDGDGLTDAEERKAGTNINVIDTDNDGLSDYEEVKIYRTNPLNADTDGDGYLDGAEVKSGYNPNGPGKLPGNEPKK